MTFRERMKHRRDANRRSRAIAHALRNSPSSALRRELMEITSRYE